MPAGERVQFQVTVVPDPILRETLEEIGFTWLRDVRRWVRTCPAGEADAYEALLRKRSIPFEKVQLRGDGELKRWPRLSAELALPDGGSALHCGLCGRHGEACRLYVECDDADGHEYDGAARFYVCPSCAAEKIEPHPRLYVRLE